VTEAHIIGQLVAQKWVLKFRPSSALLKNPPGMDPDGHSRVARTVGMNAL